MTTDTQDRLEFAVRLATTDLDTARPGDLRNLRDDLAQFLEPDDDPAPAPGTLIPSVPSAAIKKVGTKELRHLQGGAKLLLDYVADKQKGPVRAPWFDLDELRRTPYVDAEGRLLTIIEGPPSDVFFALLWKHLELAGSLAAFLHCPECDRLFLRIGKQQYCSRPCVAKANRRDYAKTAAGKAAKKRANDKRKPRTAKRKAR